MRQLFGAVRRHGQQARLMHVCGKGKALRSKLRFEVTENRKVWNCSSSGVVSLGIVIKYLFA